MNQDQNNGLRLEDLARLNIVREGYREVFALWSACDDGGADVITVSYMETCEDQLHSPLYPTIGEALRIANAIKSLPGLIRAAQNVVDAADKPQPQAWHDAYQDLVAALAALEPQTPEQ